MRYRFGLLMIGFALALQAQMQMNVQQLADFLRSELALKQHSDKQIAAYLKKITLSERLTDKTITDLVAQGAEPKTLEALRMLRDQSASIKRTAASDATYSPATAPDANAPKGGQSTAQLGVKAPAAPPPNSIDQQRILDAMRQYAMSYAQSLPNYICVRVDRRYVDPHGGDAYRSLGTLLAKVSYNEGREQYKVYSDNGKIVDSEMGGIGGGGARSSGEFAGMMGSIFDPKSNAEFGWDHWGLLRGRVMAVFNYFIDSGHSSYSIDYGSSPGDDQRIITAYKGTVYADANTGEIDRIKFEAVDIPRSFPVRTAAEMVDYDLQTIGSMQAVMPMRATLRMSTLQATQKNEIEFRNYHKYGADVVIKYDMDASAPPPAPLPDSQTQEQPVTGNPSKTAPAAKNEPQQQQPAKTANSGSNPWVIPTPPPPPPQ